MERNLTVYEWLLPVRSLYFHAPVFVLYFASRFTVEEVLFLEAVYYFSVVVLEIPSGYFSDRFGRAVTMRIAGVAMFSSFVLFLFGGDSFVNFSLAQMCMALSWSFQSGTVSTLHFDTLESLGRQEEFTSREASINSRAYIGTAVAAVIGGLTATFDIRLTYVFCVISNFVFMVMTFQFRDPPRHEGLTVSLPTQLRECAGYLARPLLLWVFFYSVYQTVVSHVPHVFAQPYITLALGASISELGDTPLLLGCIYAGAGLLAAYAVSLTTRFKDRLGAVPVLIGLGSMQSIIILAMASVVHPLVTFLIMFRSVQTGVGQILINATVTPLIRQNQRATFLSILSLSGRLCFSGLLVVLGMIAGDRSMGDPAVLSSLLIICGFVAMVGVMMLGLTGYQFVTNDE